MAFKRMPITTEAERAAEQAKFEQGLRDRHMAKAVQSWKGTVQGPTEMRHELDGARTYDFRLATNTTGVAKPVTLTLKAWQAREMAAIEGAPGVWDESAAISLCLRGQAGSWRGRPTIEAVSVEVLGKEA